MNEMNEMTRLKTAQNNDNDLVTRDGIVREIKTAIDASQRIAIFSHIRPDGDTLGSMFGLGQVLRNAGKDVQFISNDPLPTEGWYKDSGSDLPSMVRTRPEAHDLTILVDISVLDRAGDYFAENPTIVPDIVIDHHVSNTRYGRINYVDADAASTCEIITRLLPEMGYEIDAVSANFLLSGILTDTQGFSTSNTTASSLRLAADLIDRGGKIYDLSAEVLKAHSYEANGIWEVAFRNTVFDAPLIYSVIRHADRVATGYEDGDDAGVVNRLLSTIGAKVAVIFMESEDGKRTKISFRAKPGYNVSELAAQFGGGGHIAASGADVSGAVDEVLARVIPAAKAMIAAGARS